ncbi:MAG TPA: BACON domain-containing carbohydrate-binding protein, partial [Blastocatellia bacterium]|nr:BACON domain-containing carbohydrate-binding protein [Blastocatellia bacterium]
IISPLNSNRIYAATRGGVMRSLDGGANWERALNPQLVAGCLDLAIRTDQPTDFIFASCGSFQQSAVYRNADASGSGGWGEVLKDPGMGRTSITIAPSNQSVVYAASASVSNGPYLNGLHAVFRSTSGGEAGSWTAQTRNNVANKLNTVLFSNPLGAFLGECGLAPSVFRNQGWYDNVIAVDPGDANRVWVGGIDLFRSDDGGVNWGLASYWWTEKGDPSYAHADHHVITFHPQYNGATNKQMFVGTDGGVFRTNDARAPVATTSKAACNPNASGVAWTSLNNGYGVTQFYHGAVFPDGKSYFGGTQDNGTILGGDADGANAWREISGGDGGYVAVDYTNSKNIYVEATRLSIRKSIDGGATFGGARFGIDEPSDNFSFITPFAMDPNDPQKLWLGGTAIWHTKNGAANWELISHALPETPVSALAVAPTNSTLVLAGTMGGAIHRRPVGPRRTDLESWRSSRPRSGFVSSVAFDPTNHNIAYATYSTFGGSHVWRSVDGGASWSAIDGAGVTGIPDIPVHCIAIDPTYSARLYIGADLGVFVSADGGQNWAEERTGFPNTIVETLVFNTVDGVVSLYAFTHGRGAWRVIVSQSGCTLSLSSPGTSFSAAGAVGSLNVTTTPGGCTWGATSNAEWITVTGGGGSGGGTVSYSVAPNRALQSRAGTITIGGRSYFITQEKYLDTTPPRLTITSPTNTG